MIEFRQMKRPALCSMCYEPIDSSGDKVFTANSYKHHKLVVICPECAEKIYNQVKKGKSNG